MKRYTYAVMFAFSCCAAHAQQEDQSVLKKVGYTQANYEMCQALANQVSDNVMAYYYHEMLKMSETEQQSFEPQQLQIIEQEKKKAHTMLSQLNHASLVTYCETRFDPVSRQHYQRQFQQKATPLIP